MTTRWPSFRSALPILNLPAVLLRTVRMTFRPDALPAFLAMFESVSPEIRAFAGCHHLELWEDARYPNILTTFSHWESANALDAYRHSDLFRATWAKTKPWFAAPTVAHSHHVRVGPL